MYSSHSLPKQILLFHVFVTQLMFICNASSLNITNTYLHHKCLVNQGDYKPGSIFDKNLNNLIRAMSTSDFSLGFKNISVGEAPNYVTIKVQCRGDSYGVKCRSCFGAGIWGLRSKCPSTKGSIIWYDQCFIEISKNNINDMAFKKLDYENNFSMHNAKKVSGDAKMFDKETISLLENLSLKANNEANKGEDGQIALYASGEKRLGTNNVYAMVQCIRDIHLMHKMKKCKECLDTIIKEFPKCCDGKQGGRVLGTSCTFRFELYPFIRT
ncbi:unnamed protein product [Cochlearia groenlandica]